MSWRYIASVTTCNETVLERRWRLLPSGTFFSLAMCRSYVAARVLRTRGSCGHGGVYLTIPIAPFLCLYGCEWGYNFSSAIGNAQVFLYGS